MKKAEAGADASATKSNTDRGKEVGENEGGEKGSGKKEDDDDDSWGEEWRGFKPKRARRQLRKQIRCNDGFRMSVQASREHFCSPRNDVGPYDGVEVAYPSEWEDLLLPYTDNNTDRTPAICGAAPTLYVNVPPQVIHAVIQKHAGLASDSGQLPPMEEYDEDGYLWAAAAEVSSDYSEPEAEAYGSPSSAVHLGAPPPTPPPLPYRTPTTETTSAAVAAAATRVGALTPPLSLTDAGLSPIER